MLCTTLEAAAMRTPAGMPREDVLQAGSCFHLCARNETWQGNGLEARPIAHG